MVFDTHLPRNAIMPLMAQRLSDGTEFEIIHMPAVAEDGYFRDVQLAINGVLCFPFNITAVDMARFPSEDRRIAMLVRQAQSLIETYGDVRTLTGQKLMAAGSA
jgi:hypothetical protein